MPYDIYIYVIRRLKVLSLHLVSAMEMRNDLRSQILNALMVEPCGEHTENISLNISYCLMECDTW